MSWLLHPRADRLVLHHSRANKQQTLLRHLTNGIPAVTLSKPAAVAWPLIAFAILRFNNRTQDAPAKTVVKNDIALAAPFLVLSLLFSLVAVRFGHRAIGADVIHQNDFLTRIAVAGTEVWFYLWKALLPYLQPLSTRFGKSIPISVWFLWPALNIAVILWCNRRRRWAQPVLIGLTYFVCCSHRCWASSTSISSAIPSWRIIGNISLFPPSQPWSRFS